MKRGEREQDKTAEEQMIQNTIAHHQVSSAQHLPEPQ